MTRDKIVLNLYRYLNDNAGGYIQQIKHNMSLILSVQQHNKFIEQCHISFSTSKSIRGTNCRVGSRSSHDGTSG